MVKIGEQALQLQNKNENAIIQQMKSEAAEKIPCGEELQSVISDCVYTLSEWMSFTFETPDIHLEKEMQWPVEQDLIY